jgi:hypothetical protein
MCESGVVLLMFSLLIGEDVVGKSVSSRLVTLPPALSRFPAKFVRYR